MFFLLIKKTLRRENNENCRGRTLSELIYAMTKLIKSTQKKLKVRAITISGYSMTSSIVAPGAGFEETHLLSYLSLSGFSSQLYSMKLCKIKGTEWLNTKSDGERNSVKKSSIGALFEGAGWWVTISLTSVGRCWCVLGVPGSCEFLKFCRNELTTIVAYKLAGTAMPCKMSL